MLQKVNQMWDARCVEIAAFLIASIGVTLAPGPDNLFVLTQSLANGRWIGIWTAWGMVSGITVHTLGVALGLSAVVDASPTAGMILTTLGAFYLLWIAYKMWTAGGLQMQEANRSHPWTARAAYRRGLWMNLLNPKVLGFFIAFFPQFVNPNETGRIVGLGFLFMGQAFVLFSLIAVGAGSLKHWLLGEPVWQIRLNRLSAIVLILVAGSFFFERN